MKNYTYKFVPESQFLIGSPSSAGQVAITGGTLPIATTTPVVYSSPSGLTHLYDVGMSCTFRLNDLQNYGDFVNMYDAYKLGAISFNIEYMKNSSDVSSTGAMPSVYLYWDQDDSVVPTLASISGKQGVQIRHFGNNSKTMFSTQRVPFLKNATSNDLGSSAVATLPVKATWIDCTTPNVPHYALKILITDVYLPGTSTVQTAFRITWTYNVHFRSPILCT